MRPPSPPPPCTSQGSGWGQGAGPKQVGAGGSRAYFPFVPVAHSAAPDAL
jgi:hypothetical protein